MAKISAVQGREILDSRGNPTLEVRVTLEDGTIAQAGVPSGASTGALEAIELRDGDMKRYGGQGVLQAVANVNGEIAQLVIGMEASHQSILDQALITLDGTENKARLGANALLGVSLAVCRAAAHSLSIPLYVHIGDLMSPQLQMSSRNKKMPVPMFNLSLIHI